MKDRPLIRLQSYNRTRTHLASVQSRLLYPPLLAAGLVLCAYLATLAPTVFSLDSAELATAAYSLGLTHAPGYPLHLLLLHLFLQVPIGDIGYRSNLFSSLMSAGTVGILVWWCHQLYRHWLPALVAGLSFGFCFYVWSVSVVAEVYTLQGLLLALLLVLAWQWRQHGSTGALAGAVAVLGLALANTPATLLWWPGWLVLVLSTPHWRRLRPGQVLKLVAVFGLALAPLLYLPWRSAVQPAFINSGIYDATGTFHPTDLTTLAGIGHYLSGQPFAALMFAHANSSFLAEALDFGRWLLLAFFGLGFPLGAWGIWTLWQRERSLVVGLLLAIVPHSLFFISYGAPDKATMFLPVYLVWAVFLGAGVQMLRREFSERSAHLLLLLPLTMALVNAPFASQHHAWDTARLAQHRLREAPAGALYLAHWGDAETMRYYQVVEGLRPDVHIINIFFVPPQTRVPLIDHALASGQSVYTTFREARFAGHYRIQMFDYGYRLNPH